MAAYHQQVTGLVERFTQMLKTMIGQQFPETEGQNVRNLHLHKIIQAYNTAFHESLEETLFLIHGYHPGSKVTNTYGPAMEAPSVKLPGEQHNVA